MFMEAISRIDQRKGVLYYRGIRIEELATSQSYESVLFLLLRGRLPNDTEIQGIRQKLATLRKPPSRDAIVPENARKLPEIMRHEGIFSGLEGIDKLLSYVSNLPNYLLLASSIEELSIKSLGHSPSGHAKHVYTLYSRNSLQEYDLRDFETCLVLHMDDPENPSLTALKRSYSKNRIITEALGNALAKHSEPLHHGAGYEAYKMLIEVRKSESVEKALQERLDAGRRIFGLGHRIYKTLDPRARILSMMLKKRTKGTDLSWLPELVSEVAKTGANLIQEQKGIQIHPNVDLYNAAVYSTLGIHPRFNTDLFAIARSAGWIAHLLEMLDD